MATDRVERRAQERVWDPLLRFAHWTIALAVLADGLLIDDDAAAHVWVGYAAVGVLALRILWGFVGPETARFASFPPDPRAALAHLGDILAGRRTDPHRSRNPLGALMAYGLWAMLALVCLTGVMMESDAFWGVEWVEEMHEASANLLLAMAALHVGGVLFESRRSGVNLVAPMLDGVRRRPAPPR